MARYNRLSYFAEIRQTKSDPNYFNKESQDNIRKNVRRILKDVVSNNIIDEDYIYFTNTNLLDACIAESQEQYVSNDVIARALEYYTHSVLPYNMQPYWVNAPNDFNTARQEQSKATERKNAWWSANDAFNKIKCGADPRIVLTQLYGHRDAINKYL